MSTMTVRLSVRHEGQQVPQLPLTTRVESTTHVAQLVDAVWPDNDSQEPAASSSTPFFALRFDKPVSCQMGPNTGLLNFALGGGGFVLFMGSGGVSFAANANAPIRAQGVV